jgi:hypothetical protein
VREITGVYSEGAAPIGEAKVGPDGMSKHFRQTYRPDGTDKFLTSVMRETNDGSWVATFPGSEKLVLCNRYGLPMIEFKMARRQGATREHVLCDL